MRRFHAFLLLAALGPAAAGQDGGAADLPLGRVVLFTSGVGYFQRDGTVLGDAKLELRFDAGDINDLLKSMVLRDLDGGTISGVTYTSRDPVAKTLRSFAIDLTNNPSLAQILAQARGEKVEVIALAPLTGTIVGVETKQVPAGDHVVEQMVLTLLTDGGLQGVSLNEVQRIRLLRPELERELRQALAALAASHDTQKKSVSLSFKGEGQRRVRVAYIAESPVWKTSYRLVLADGEAPFLQGWAIVENTSEEDWTDVKLTLVSGRPISFLMDLYQPLYVERPWVEFELYRSLKPQKYAEAMEELLEAEEPAPGAPAESADAGFARGRRAAVGGRKGADNRAEKDFLGKSVSSAADAGQVGELFQYEIRTPVTLPRQQSALLPIVNSAVEGEKLSIYNEQVHAKYPLNGLRLKNTSGLHLMQGPITVFDGGTYAGDARIDDLQPNGERLLSYALDLDREVEPVREGSPERLVSARIVRGTLVTTRQYRRTTTYNARNRGQRDRTLLIEAPFQADWRLVEPAEPTERTRDVYRFALPVAAGKAASLKVVEERTVDQTIAVTNLSHQLIEYYLQAREVSEEVKAFLRRTVELKDAVARTDQEIRRHEQRTREIGDEQARIRENLKTLPQNSPLYARYIATLTEQEDELEAIRKRLAELRDRRAAEQKALEDYLLSR